MNTCNNESPTTDFAYALENIIAGRVCGRESRPGEFVYAREACVRSDIEFLPVLVCHKRGRDSVYVPQPGDYLANDWRVITTPPVDIKPEKLDVRGSHQSFAYALRQMRTGARVKRDGWAAEIVKLDTILLDEGGRNPMPKALIMRDHALGEWHLWTPSFGDLFLADWRVHSD
jgi:hypothetical protein